MNTPFLPPVRHWFYLAMLATLLAGDARAQLVITVTNAAGYSQNFDSMGSSASSTNTPPGWFVGGGTGAISGTNVTVGDGSTAAIGNYNWGTSGNSDRALGSLSGGARDTEARFVNNSGLRILSFTLSYTGEQWRQGGVSGQNDALSTQYSTDGTNFTAMGAAFDFNTPQDSGAAGALDGNQATNRVPGIGGTYTPASPITNGQTFYLRWSDVDVPAAPDHGMGIDDFSISFTLSNPPPSVITQAAGNVTSSSATLNGNINPNNLTTTAWFQWGTTTNYGNTTATASLPATNTMLVVSNGITGLLPATTYHFRATATSSSGTNFGSDLVFTTLSTNANLSNLTLSSGTLSPAFNTNTVSYAASVANSNASVTITLTSVEATASIQVQVNGGGYSGASSGSPSSALILNVGENTIDVRVTAQDATTIKTYTLNVTRVSADASTNANLSGITLSSGAFTPAFDSNTVSYTASVPNSTNSLTVTPTTADTNATIQVRVNDGGFAGVASGSSSSTLVLTVGTNAIDVRVTAQDATTIKTYTLTVTRAGPPAVTTLPATGVTTTVASLRGSITPNGLATTAWFQWGTTTNYGSDTETTSLPATNVALVVARTLFTLTLNTTYHFRAAATNSAGTNFGGDLTFTTAARTNADLSGLTLSSGAYSPAFHANTLSYAASVPHATNSVTVTPTKADSRATIQVQVNGSGFFGVTSGTASIALPLYAGTNTIDVRVTAEDATAIKTYTLTVTRAVGPPAVATLAANGISTNTALLHGSINPNGLATTAWFEWGTTTSYGHETGTTSLSATNIALAVGNGLTGLTTDTAYHFRAVAFNSDGTNFGSDLTFTAENPGATITFTNPTPEISDEFGIAVAAVGTDMVLIGAWQDDTGATDAGAAYLFSIHGTLLTTITNPTPAVDNNFGWAVVGVGADKLLIGAYHDDTGANNAGAAYLFSTNGTLLTTFTNPTPAASDHFGYAVAAVGTDMLLITAYLDDTGAGDAGTAYLYSTNGTLLTTISNPAPAASDLFGHAVAAVGADKVLIGAFHDNTGAADAGTAYLFSTNGTLLTTFTNPSPMASDEFGRKVAAVGEDKVLIGAYFDDTGATDAGAAYLFSINGTLLTTFTNPTPAASDFFGNAVAAAGTDRVLIGAYGDNAGAANSGVAYLFSINGTLLTTFTNPTPVASDNFGWAVAAADPDKVLIGAYGVNIGATDAGVAYLLSLNGPPSIGTQPQSRGVTVGSNTTFTVGAAGTEPLSYQWRFNATNISGATTSIYARNNAQPTEAGDYSVVVTNIFGAVTSSVATLTVNVMTTPAVLSAPAYLAYQQFQFGLAGDTGANYEIQASTNLSTTNWVSLSTNTAPFLFIDSNAMFYPQRFYRARSLP